LSLVRPYEHSQAVVVDEVFLQAEGALRLLDAQQLRGVTYFQSPPNDFGASQQNVDGGYA
jgi:hypothetical protein